MSKLILTSEVTGLGSAGDVVEVKNGYARNYLIPQGFAVAWSRGGEKQIDSIKAARAARELATLEEAQALKAKLEGTAVKLTVKAGREGRLFGSVKTADIADAVAAAGSRPDRQAHDRARLADQGRRPVRGHGAPARGRHRHAHHRRRRRPSSTSFHTSAALPAGGAAARLRSARDRRSVHRRPVRGPRFKRNSKHVSAHSM